MSVHSKAILDKGEQQSVMRRETQRDRGAAETERGMGVGGGGLGEREGGEREGEQNSGG